MRLRPYCLLLLTILLLASSSAGAQQNAVTSTEQRISALLAQMTLEEKIGQLTQYSGRQLTGPASDRKTDFLNSIRAGQVGSMLNVTGAQATRKVQAEAMKSRLKIPLLFGLNVIHGYQPVRVQFRVTNTGTRADEEVTQFYLHDVVASVARPLKELKDFQKLSLKPGESRTVTFTLDQNKLAFYNPQLVWAAEPGDFQLFIGSASDDIRLEGKLTLVP